MWFVAPVLIFVAVILISPQRVGAELGPDDLARAIATIQARDLEAHVKILSSDEFEGRAPSTPGEEKTLQYLEREFRKVGVEPAVRGSYLQKVPLVSKIVLPTTKLIIQGRGDPVALRLGDDYLIGTGTVEDQEVIEASEIVFVGYGIVAPEYGWNDYEGLNVEGKTVFVLLNDPGRDLGDTTFFKGKALSYYGTNGYKQEEAARRGANAIFLLHDPDIFQVPWSTLKGSLGKPRFSALPDPDSPAKPAVTGIIHWEAIIEILKQTEQTFEELKRAAIQTGFRAIPLNIYASGSVDIELAHSESHNLVGIIRGSERQDEYVLYTAHWDHVGVGQAVDGDSVYNGAVDNATGTAGLLEIAQAYQSLPEPAGRSIVFLGCTAEEQGLLGSSYYADNPVFPLSQTMAVINMDALFPFGEQNGMTVVAMGSSELEDYLEVAATAQGRTLQPNPSPEHGAFFRSDHYPFAKKGVPALFAVGGPLDDPPPSEELIARYNEFLTQKYHKPSDEFDENWDSGGIIQDVRIHFQTGYSIAIDDRVPNWYLTSEFRAIRDRSRDGRFLGGGESP